MEFVDFGYCLWLMCEPDEELSKLTNGFEAHMSIITKLSLTEALDLYECLEKDTSIVVEVVPEKEISYENGFNAIYFKVKYDEDNKKKKPQWWPENAHISMRYKYNSQFTIDELRMRIFDKKCKMRGLKIMKCVGHHDTWKWIM
tara:strand:- start:273 stop:704 length:432 start_codon:yes stop_codon:yes gene_type:complete